MSRLSVDDFLRVVTTTPLVAIDLIVQNTKGQIFLGKRVNEPAKDFWFVPGGRIFKNETIKNALVRLLKEELGLDHFNGSFKLVGIYDHMYETCFYRPNPQITNTHYVVIGLMVQLEVKPEVKPKVEPEVVGSQSLVQHSCFQWMAIEDLLENEMVHPNTKNYFRHPNEFVINF